MGQRRSGGADTADVVVALGEGFLRVFDDGVRGDVAGHGDESWCQTGGAPGEAVLATVRASMHAPTLPADAPRSARPEAGTGLRGVALLGLVGALVLAWGVWQVGGVVDRRLPVRW